MICDKLYIESVSESGIVDVLSLSIVLSITPVLFIFVIDTNMYRRFCELFKVGLES